MHLKKICLALDTYNISIVQNLFVAKKGKGKKKKLHAQWTLLVMSG